jgi:hypothetical protein
MSAEVELPPPKMEDISPFRNDQSTKKKRYWVVAATLSVKDRRKQKAKQKKIIRGELRFD